MEFELPLPAPFLFNGLKHHRQVISEFIHRSIELNYSIADLNLRMKKIGNSMIDLYYGYLKPGDIADEIASGLKSKGCFARQDYTNYIFETPKKYRSTTLSDGSEWTLLFGKDSDAYVHIHPSRGSKFTKRVKAISIRTAIMLMIFFEKELLTENLISLVNSVRIDYLHESPIVGEKDTIRLKKVLDLL